MSVSRVGLVFAVVAGPALEAGIEMRLGPHIALRPFFGVALLLNPNAGVAVIGQFGEQPSRVEAAPYVGLAVGYAPVAEW